MPVKRWLPRTAVVVLTIGMIVALSPKLEAESPKPTGIQEAPSSPAGRLEPSASANPSRAGASSAAAVPDLHAGLPPLSPQAAQQAEVARQELLDWIDELLEVYPYLAANGPTGMQETLERLREEIPSMTSEEIAAIKAEIGSHPGFWEFPQFLLAVFEPDTPMPDYYRSQLEIWRQAEKARIAADRLVVDLPSDAPLAVPSPNPTPSPYPTSDPFPPRTLPDQPPNREVCPGVFSGDTCDECPNAVPLEAVWAAKVVAIIANAVNDSAGTSDQDICVPPGVGFTVPDVIKWIFIGVKSAADAAVQALEFANTLNADCEDAFRNALVDHYLDETVSSRVSQASLDAHADLLVRLEIENNLLLGADDRVSLFQLPESVCGERIPDDVPTQTSGEEGYLFCGKLELVREIVDDTIARNAAAGMTPEISQAMAELQAGDAQYDLQHYKSAYERYSAAYRYAVQQPTGR